MHFCSHKVYPSPILCLCSHQQQCELQTCYKLLTVANVVEICSFKHLKGKNVVQRCPLQVGMLSRFYETVQHLHLFNLLVSHFLVFSPIIFFIFYLLVTSALIFHCSSLSYFYRGHETMRTVQNFLKVIKYPIKLN